MVCENAWRSTWRRKGYSILLIVVFTIITAAVVVSLAIMQAAVSAKTTGLADQTVTATIGMERSKIIKDAQSSDSSGPTDADTREAARTAMEDMKLTLSEYESYASAAGDLLKTSYYTESAGLTAVDGEAEPVSSSSSTSGSDDSSTSSDPTASADRQMQPGGDMGGDASQQGGMGNSSDFTLLGLSSDEALESLGITVSDGEAVATGTSNVADSDGDDSTYDAMVTDEFAQLNGLEVGDTFVAADSDGNDITFTIVGTYTSAGGDSADSGGGPGGFGQGASDRIIVSMTTLTALGLEADSSDGTTISYTYVLGSGSDYDAFVQACSDAGLSDSYAVSSTDVDTYEESIEPLLNLAKFAKTLLIVVLALGAVMLIAMTLFSIRTRTYEMGVMTAMGMHKRTVAAQMVVETLIVAVIGLAIGTSAGAVASVPVSNGLLASEVSSAQSESEQQERNFGRQLQGGAAPGAQGSGTDSATDATSGSASADASSADVPSADAAPTGASSSDSSANTQQNAPSGAPGQPGGMQRMTEYVSTVNASVDLKTVGLAALAILLLALLSGLVGVIWVLRYEPLQILADRS